MEPIVRCGLAEEEDQQRQKAAGMRMINHDANYCKDECTTPPISSSCCSSSFPHIVPSHRPLTSSPHTGTTHNGPPPHHHHQHVHHHHHHQQHTCLLLIPILKGLQRCTCDRYAVKTRCRADLQDAGRVHVGADWETERQRHGIPGAWVSAWCFSTPQTREEAKPLGEKTTNSESPALPVLNWPDSPANSSLTLVASVFLQKASS